jgi:hypothetical protein
MAWRGPPRPRDLRGPFALALADRGEVVGVLLGRAPVRIRRLAALRARLLTRGPLLPALRAGDLHAHTVGAVLPRLDRAAGKKREPRLRHPGLSPLRRCAPEASERQVLRRNLLPGAVPLRSPRTLRRPSGASCAGHSRTGGRSCQAMLSSMLRSCNFTGITLCPCGFVRSRSLGTVPRGLVPFGGLRPASSHCTLLE